MNRALLRDRPTRDRLVAATREAIAELGLPAVTAREITARASANLAAIPYHFGSKDALVAEALVADVEAMVAPVLEVLEGDAPPEVRALGAASLLGDLFSVERHRVPAYLAALAAAPHVPGLRDRLAELWRELRTRLTADIEAQRDAGLVPSWVDSLAMAALVLDVVNGVVVASVIDPDGPDHHAVAGQLLALLMTVREESP